MRKITTILAFMFLALVQQACFTHYVMDDYPKYLENNKGSLVLPQLNKTLSYNMDVASSAHKKDVRSFQAGAGNTWVIEFGRMLRATMQSQDVMKAFKSVAENDSKADISLSFRMLNYDFTKQMAQISMKVTLKKGARTQVFTKTYSANGKSQGGKMFFAGAMGMKNAVQQSTKLAMDEILSQLMNDIKKELNVRNV